ncbi:MAG: SPOR domain-containing protein [Bacteroidota bacterium]|nr:SPOR domain-containing protein [Bacteroidota bacterium]
MTPRKAYSSQAKAGRVLFSKIFCSYCILAVSLLFSPLKLYSQELPEYDEISVLLDVRGVGGGEIDALIRDNKDVYLPVTDLFDFLKIKNTASPGMETISGFFIIPEALFEIDRGKNQISYQGKTFELEPGDLIRTESKLYLKALYYGKVFGLECTFNFRSLSVTVNSKLELPVIKEMRQEEMRRNLARLRNEVKADTNIKRSYPLFRFGMADWAVNSSQEINGQTDTRLNLNLGAMLAGGEATASLYYNSTDPFTEKQQYYLWRYVNNDFSPLRQALAGKISTNSISSIYNPVIGIQLTNTPTTYRRSFGSYTLSDKTEPGWIVELYVNNELVDYTKADASGFYTFEVPLVYGISVVKLKFYGPWGEERSREQNISIPYNFLPRNTMEYTLSAGIVEDTLASRFSRASVNYGLTRSLTIGGGAEYLSSVTNQPLMPYVNASLRVTNNLLLSGEYAYGVRAKGTLSYRLPSNLQLDLNYTWYDKNQKAIFYNYREERRATLSMPLKIGKSLIYNRLSAYQIILPSSKYTTGEWLISGSLFGVNTNLTTYALLLKDVKPYFYSNLALAFRLPAGFVLMPQVQYGYTENKLFSAKARLEKHVLKNGFINLSYEQNFRNDLRLAEVGFRYDFSFAQAGASVRQTNDRTSFIEYARGSIINDRKTKYLGTDNRTNVGRGGISVIPFLDLNNNGKRDAGEPKAYGLNLQSSGGRIEKSDRDTTIRIFSLEPYTNCFIELDPNSFENISWRIVKKTYNVAVDPNIFKLIEIPVTIAGEANGNVLLESEGEKKGQGRIIIDLYDSYQKSAGKTISEDDGYFSYLGLAPGSYTVRVDTAQLRKLGMSSSPETRQFRIRGGAEGDIVDNLDFVLKAIRVDTTTKKPVVPEVVIVRKDTTNLTIHEVTERVYTITKDSWAIQIGAFKSKSLAEGFRNMLRKELGKDVQITVAGDYYRVRIMDLTTREEVDENIAKLNKLGFKELWIIRLIAMQQERLLVTREDSLARIRQATIGHEAPLTDEERTQLQLGAFRLGSSAIGLRKQISAPLDRKVELKDYGMYYRLKTPEEPMLDPTVLNAMKELIPEAGHLGYESAWVIPVKSELAKQPEVRVPVELPKVPVQSETSLEVSRLKVMKPAFERRPSIPEPSIALQVAIYYKESQALRAQRRIQNKLNLPVEIVRQWDTYHVIVVGFYTREETYRYYPELAGIGFPGITLIENYKRQK